MIEFMRLRVMIEMEVERVTRLTRTLLVMAFVLTCAICYADDLAIARSLMDPTSYPDAQFGMAITYAKARGSTITVDSTGAEFIVQTDQSKIVCYQRIGMQRKCATITLPVGFLTDARILSRKPGGVIIDSPLARVRLNSDSLVMIETKQAGSVSISVHFVPGCHWTYGSNRLVLDNYGGIAAFPIGSPCPYGQPPGTAPGANWYTFSISLDAEQVLWVSICPPKPYDWSKSYNEKYFMYWTNVPEQSYPSNATIATHLGGYGVGNRYVLASDMAMWYNWQVTYNPRYGVSELARCINTSHLYGAKLFVYTSPLYFVKGTPLESQAADMTSVGGWETGENIDLFLSEIQKVVGYGVDGLYYDTPYTTSLVNTYRVIRNTRTILGDNRMLCWHATFNPPGNNWFVYCPTIDAYANVMYRGEDVPLHTIDSYRRFVMSAYNVSNTTGIACVNAVPESERTQAFVDAVLDVNGRFMWDLGSLVKTYYWPQLNDSLKTRVEQKMAERNAVIAPPPGAPPNPPP